MSMQHGSMKSKAAIDFFINFSHIDEHLRHDAQKHAISDLSIEVGIGKLQAASRIQPITAFKRFTVAA